MSFECVCAVVAKWVAAGPPCRRRKGTRKELHVRFKSLPTAAEVSSLVKQGEFNRFSKTAFVDIVLIEINEDAQVTVLTVGKHRK